MQDKWLNHWNDKFAAAEYAYGTTPNVFYKAQIDKIPSGKILLGAEGEGRNAVYAATQGWDVSAFDISQEGKKKALQLAKEHNVEIDYTVGLLPELAYEDETFDALALLYAHFPPEIRPEYHKILGQKVKQGGWIILEGFGENQLKYREVNPNIGGPRTQELLFSIDELKTAFKDFEIILLEEVVTELHQGIYHNGTGSVIRFIGQKK